MSKFIFLKSLRDVLVPLKRLIDKKAEAPNWNENDPASKSYIANRTHYKEIKEKYTVKDKNIELSFVQGDIGIFDAPFLDGNVGDIFTIVWDGTEYKCKVNIFEDFYALGNKFVVSDLVGEEFLDTGEPFVWIFYPGEVSQIYTLELNDHIVSCFNDVAVVHKIPSEYLPEMSSVGKEGEGEHSEIFNDYENNYAEGFYSHAEGHITYTSGYASHAEGAEAYADGYASHAEGNGVYAVGYASHAEGGSTYADGDYSHVEGYQTQAFSAYQHVQGKYNTLDNNNKYAHIVGNGTGPYTSQRKNAHTLDWNGLGWFASGIKVGGTGQDDSNAKTLATEAYVDNKISAIPTPDVSGQIATAVASLVDSAPETLNTLKELSNALGDDPNFATTVTTQLGNLEKQIVEPKDGIVLIDQVNGYHYIGCMRDGNFVTYCATQSIELTKMPDKSEYYAGDVFDPTGMIITAKAYDGSLKEVTKYSYSENIPNGVTSIEIIYYEAGNEYAVEVPITLKPMTELLQDFEYTDNGDGTYTLTAWKGTLNGEPSTEIVIPDHKNIIL